MQKNIHKFLKISPAAQIMEKFVELEKVECKMSFYVTRYFSKSCKILMFFLLEVSRDHRSRLKTKPSNCKNVLINDNEKTLKEFRLQKYLFDHYMIWKIDCFLFASPWSQQDLFIYFWKPFPRPSPPPLACVLAIVVFKQKSDCVYK